jgi:hypothetical protein
MPPYFDLFDLLIYLQYCIGCRVGNTSRQQTGALFFFFLATLAEKNHVARQHFKVCGPYSLFEWAFSLLLLLVKLAPFSFSLFVLLFHYLFLCIYFQSAKLYQIKERCYLELQRCLKNREKVLRY